MPSINVRTADALNSLLRGELAAAETYAQAIRKASGGHDDEIASGLAHLHDRHVDAASLLRQVVSVKHEVPASSSGAWGTFAKAVEGTATLLGNAAAIKVLLEGEEHGAKEYQRILEFEDLDPGARILLSQLHAEQKDHPREVERLLRRT